MQVTRDTFPVIFPKFVELLKTCDFYAFDEEMTGINTAELPETITDTPEESYRAKRTVASRYNIIQVGICLFHRDATAAGSTPAQYVARPFNFLLFPHHADDFTADERSRDVVLSPSSLAFLRRHDMNFQSWVYQGMAYCDARQEEALRNRYAEKYQEMDRTRGAEKQETQEINILTEDERKWYNNAVAQAQSFAERVQAALERAKGKNGGQTAVTAEVAASVDLIQSGGRDVLLPPQRGKSAREALERYIAQHCHSLSITFRRQGAVHIGVLRAVFPEQRRRLLEKEQSFRERDLMNMLGFRLVFKALVSSKKPCVGHNCFADLLFLVASLDGPLPDTLPEFKLRMQELFPTVFDTRYVATRQAFFPVGRFGDRYLSGFFGEYGFRSAHVQVTLPLGFESYDPLAVGGNERRHSSASGDGGGPTHEAGYDALLTGTLLLNLLAEMGGYDVATAPECVVNRVAIFRSLFALQLENPSVDEYLPESGVLDLRHEKGVKTYHIESCFTALSLQDVELYSVDGTRTLAVLPFTWSKLGPHEQRNPGWLSTHMTSRFPQIFEAAVYQPTATSVSTKGAFYTTPRALMRVCLHSALR
ncbi:putative ribonuclease [Trypanosoma rangeli]|uniref:Putative ribonuclease n=1 Tax=Trypanosoma rangeli TaxID=5698 RepID=A0A422N5N5_TRYRA|nr:putative ribonuclease [Trypanosoma rangeli]RNF00766.1 putative ribonuclease [Trypanosoma rangeli]|eukprot:RNF00766.1 putative ribonuclease [Trypanosoma rangeli]